jgi:hypothetical protein
LHRVSTTVVLWMVFVEAAVLGIGLAVGFPRFGPHDLARAALLLAGALLLNYSAPPLVGATASAAGAPAAVVLVVLPALTAMFWTAGCFFRLIATALARAPF